MEISEIPLSLHRLERSISGISDGSDINQNIHPENQLIIDDEDDTCKSHCEVIRKLFWISALVMIGIFTFFTPLGDPKVECTKLLEVDDETALVYSLTCVSYKYLVKAMEGTGVTLTNALNFSSSVFSQALTDSKSKGICIPSTGEDMDLRCFHT